MYTTKSGFSFQEWVKEAFVEGKDTTLEFESPRVAETARCRMYVYLKETEQQGQFTIKRAGARLLITSPVARAPKVVPGKEPTAQGATKEEQELLSLYDLKVKTLSIGDTTYWTITNDNPTGDYKYQTTLMAAIQVYLNSMPQVVLANEARGNENNNHSLNAASQQINPLI